MKTLLLIMSVIMLCVSQSNSQTEQNEFPVLKGEYFGQKPPGMTPEIFAPGIISTGLYTRDISMPKSGDEIFFGVIDGNVAMICVTKIVNNKWTEPAVAEFSGKGFNDLEPHFSPDGNTLFFLSTRPPKNQPPKPGWFYQDIWKVTRTDSGWSEPQRVDEPISTSDNEFYPSVTHSNILYFTRNKRGEVTRLFRAVFKDNVYETPTMVQLPIPDTALVFNTFVSPKEDYLITCATKIDSSNIDQDYYISFKVSDGTWGELIKFGPEFNTPGDNANSAFVTPDGKYLFFSSSRTKAETSLYSSGATIRSIIDAKSRPGNGASAIYWVDAKVIEELRPKAIR